VTWVRKNLVLILGILVLIYTFIPIFVVILMSFNDPTSRLIYQFDGFTLHNWQNPCEDPDMCSAVRLSIEIGLLATLVATVLGTAMLIVRAFEIPNIPFHWAQHAYGSVFWMIFGVHIAHVLTGVLENAMLIALLCKGPVEKKHFGDIEASALLWYFVVLEWVPAFAILYLEPRW